MRPKVYQLNVKPQAADVAGLPKYRVDPLAVTERGAVNDYNKYRTEKNKSDPDRALLLLPLEVIADLNREGWSVNPGDLGENITSKGLEWNDLHQDDVYEVGSVLVKLKRLATPCWKLGLLPYVGKTREKEFIKTLIGRRGWYCRVLEPGIIRVNDELVKMTKIRV